MDTQQSPAGNPLIDPSPLKHRAIPFDRIETAHFLPALDGAIAAAMARIAAIKAETAPADFDNTILPLETAGEDVDLVCGVFYNLLGAERTEELQALAAEIGPKGANYSSDILLDPAIFARVKQAYDRRAELSLTVEQAQLLDDTYQGFVRNGALLNDNEKGELRAIDERLSVIGPDFSQNVLKDTNAFTLVIEDPAELSGLPESIVAAAAEAARQQGHDGKWLFTLDMPSYLPFLKFVDRRELRERMWRAFAARGLGGAHDNQPLIREMVGLRHRRATLLGFRSHADFVLQRRMAGRPANVHAFLERILEAAHPAAERDLADVQALARAENGPDPLMPWDFGYYAEKLKQARFALNDEELRPYFRLDRVLDGVFLHARKLYGLVFEPTRDYPTYHPDVQVFEVRDETRGDFVGLFYADFFPRPGKRNGAWMTTFREQGLYHGEVLRPHVAIVCNFTKPTQDKPSLLTYDEVRTLFHEMGHALHGMLSQCTYRSLAGTNVLWDFVELPSQIFENWVEEKESLDLFASHFETGEPIPAALAQKIKDSARFLAGYQALRQTGLGMLDMAWHDRDPSGIESVTAFERQVTDRTTVLPRVEGSNISASFSHIFSGGYSAGYYSYKWAEVLDADAFELFRQNGLFDRETAERFKSTILERGGTEPPMELYKRFRGREPDPDAMLRRDGLI